MKKILYIVIMWVPAIAMAQGNNAGTTTDQLKNQSVTGDKMSQDGATTGQVWKWNGTTWAPANDDAGAGGDNWGTQVAQVTARLSGNGTAGNPLEIAQQGATTGQALKWNGTSWSPAADAGVVSVGPVNATATANGASITGTTLNLHEANVSNAGIVSVGAQQWAGPKTFSSTGAFSAQMIANATSGNARIGLSTAGISQGYVYGTANEVGLVPKDITAATATDDVWLSVNNSNKTVAVNSATGNSVFITGNKIRQKSTSTTATSGTLTTDFSIQYFLPAGAASYTMPAATAEVWLFFHNQSNFTVTLNGDINNGTSLSLPAHTGVTLHSDGTAWYTF